MATPTTYDIGALAKLSVEITVGGTDTDPSGITLTVVDPAGTVTTVAGGSLTHDGTGKYHYLFDLTGAIPGIWSYSFAGTGTAQGAEWNTFFVEAART